MARPSTGSGRCSARRWRQRFGKRSYFPERNKASQLFRGAGREVAEDDVRTGAADGVEGLPHRALLVQHAALPGRLDHGVLPAPRPSIMSLGATRSIPARACVTATLPSRYTDASFSTSPSWITPQCP